MRTSIASPSQYALKLPATRPDRMFSDAPPCRDDVTTSRTWAEFIDVNTFTSSGITAPASVPQVMTVESFHHSVGSPLRLGIMRYDTRYVRAIDTSEVSHTSVVSGASKSILSAPAYFTLV